MRQPKSLAEKEAAFLGEKTPAAEPEAPKEPAKPKKKKKTKGFDNTKDSEKPVNVNLNEYYREHGDELAKVMPNVENRKQLLKLIIMESMDKLIEEHL